jgi:hypothetical protein
LGHYHLISSANIDPFYLFDVFTHTRDSFSKVCSCRRRYLVQPETINILDKPRLCARRPPLAETRIDKESFFLAECENKFGDTGVDNIENLSSVLPACANLSDCRRYKFLGTFSVCVFMFLMTCLQTQMQGCVCRATTLLLFHKASNSGKKK